MKKRWLSVCLVLALTLGLLPSAFAAEAQVSESEAAQVLAALEVMTGDEKGNLNLDRQVTRAEFTKLTIAASTYAYIVAYRTNVSPYPDVPRDNWAAPYIDLAKDKELVQGYLDGTFRPMNHITLVEGVSMVLSLLGYQNADFTGAWGSGQMGMYESLKLNRGITIGRDIPMTRRDALWLFYNLMTAKAKNGQVYLTNLGHSLTSSGEIDRVALLNSVMEGPVVVENGWQESIPFDVTTATVYRAGAESSFSAITNSDVVYWSESMRTLWAYTKKITGTIQKITPSASRPTAVEVNNQSYTIETATAAYDLSDLGPFKVGDAVTLLQGRDSQVAAVRRPMEENGTVYGIVLSSGTGTYQDANGKSYTTGTVTLTATDGDTYTYRWENKDKKWEAGDMVQVTVSDSGTQISKLNRTTLTGSVSADGKTLGDYSFASDVEIMDTYAKTTLARVYPSRLSGVKMTSDMVRYYALNSKQEISHLILNDVTGDMHQFGVLTDVKENEITSELGGMTTQSIYSFDINGQADKFTSNKVIWGLKRGPCEVKRDGQTVDRIYNLSQFTLERVDGNKATVINKTYTVADDATVYELRNNTYYQTNLNRVSDGKYTLTGWYDKAEEQGGRIRVILAVEKK